MKVGDSGVDETTLISSGSHNREVKESTPMVDNVTKTIGMAHIYARMHTLAHTHARTHTHICIHTHACTCTHVICNTLHTHAGQKQNKVCCCFAAVSRLLIEISGTVPALLWCYGNIFV